MLQPYAEPDKRSPHSVQNNFWFPFSMNHRGCLWRCFLKISISLLLRFCSNNESKSLRSRTGWLQALSFWPQMPKQSKSKTRQSSRQRINSSLQSSENFGIDGRKTKVNDRMLDEETEFYKLKERESKPSLKRKSNSGCGVSGKKGIPSPIG